jgi:integrase
MAPNDVVKLPRFHQKGLAYYHVTSARPRKWTPLGSDLVAAMKEYKRLERSAERHPGTVAAIVHAYIESRRDKLTASSRSQYRAWADHLARVFDGMAPAEISRADVLQYLDTCPRTSVRSEISLLRQALEREVRGGRLEHNPCVGAKPIEPIRSKRTRLLTDPEFAQIRDHAGALLRVAMELAYQTGLRVSDLCRLRWNDFDQGGHVHTEKTGARMRYAITDDLAAVLEAARALSPRVATLTVLSERSRPVNRHRIGDLWRAACAAAGVVDAQFRDIRAKSATDADETGQDAQKLLGHTTPATTRTYLRGRKITPVIPLRRRDMENGQ